MEGRAADALLARFAGLRAAASPEGDSGRGYPRLWRGVPAESRDSGKHWTSGRSGLGTPSVCSPTTRTLRAT